MPTLAQDCEVMLYHAEVQQGQALGLLLDHSRLYHGSISVYRSAYRVADGTFQEQQMVSFTVLLADGLVNPDGSLHTITAADEYNQLFQILNQRSEIGVITPEGIFSGLFSSGNYSQEERNGGVLRVTLQLSSSGDVFAPADRDRFEQSLWVDEDMYAGSMTWNNSYWRA
jgi:hypothetical protein